jgi:hypothetical protein
MQVTSVPYGARRLHTPATVVLETGAPALVIRSVPLGALRLQTPATAQVDVSITSVPAPRLRPQSWAKVTLVLPPPPRRPLRTWQRDVQAYAISLERQRHVQALWQFGELAIFALLWTTLDFASGFAARCPRCFITPGDVDNETQFASAYGQGNQYNCPVCFNSQFVAASPLSGSQPGLRALLIRPTIFTEIDKDTQQHTGRGVMNPANVNAETTPDFRVRSGDYMFRADGTRFRLRVPHRVTVRTGFAEPWQQPAAITYEQLSAGLEDPTSVAFIIPPDAPTLQLWLGTYTRVPVDYSWAEVINGPLIPGEAPPPAAGAALQPDEVFPLGTP